MKKTKKQIIVLRKKRFKRKTKLKKRKKEKVLRSNFYYVLAFRIKDTDKRFPLG